MFQKRPQLLLESKLHAKLLSTVNADPCILGLSDGPYLVVSLAPQIIEHFVLLRRTLLRKFHDLRCIDRTILVSDEHDLAVHPHSNMFPINYHHLEAGQRVLHPYRSRMKYFVSMVRFRKDL